MQLYCYEFNTEHGLEYDFFLAEEGKTEQELRDLACEKIIELNGDTEDVLHRVYSPTENLGYKLQKI